MLLALSYRDYVQMTNRAVFNVECICFEFSLVRCITFVVIGHKNLNGTDSGVPLYQSKSFSAINRSADTGNEKHLEAIWRGNKMASKRRKLDRDNKPSEIEREKDENAEIRQKETLIYIIPKKIPKARLQVLNNLARKKGFPITEHYRSANVIYKLKLKCQLIKLVSF